MHSGCPSVCRCVTCTQLLIQLDFDVEFIFSLQVHWFLSVRCATVLSHMCQSVRVYACVCTEACLYSMCVCVCVGFSGWFCTPLHAAVKCIKANCIFCTAKCKMPHCGERDYAFVSRAYADVCSCPTNVTSHNPEKLHQSHLITHIHDAVLHSAGSVLLLQATELRDMVEWKGFQSTDTVRLCHKHQLDNATSMPIFLWSETIMLREFSLISCSQSYCHCLQHVQPSWE